MKKKIALFIAAALFAPSAFAMEITPYVGLGIVADSANTSAKRVKFDASKLDYNDLKNSFGNAFVPNAGGNMDFDMAFAGEITAGVKIDNFRAELEVAIRSASEDDYDIYNDTLDIPMDIPMPGIGQLPVPTEIENSISVRHNSYLANFFYDFDFGTKWTPYVGAGVGFGVYRQKATVEIDIDEDLLMAELGQIPPAVLLPMISQFEREIEVANDTLYRFEWQVSAGVAYNFNENWALDLGYRFNSSTVGGEFVYAHEVKLGARYSF